MICSKISKTTGILSRLKHFLPISILRTIYCSLIQSRLIYAITAWYSPCPELKHLTILQKKAIRQVSSAHYNSHTIPLFKNLNLLKLSDIFSVNCCILYFNTKHALTSPHISSCLIPNTQTTFIPTRQIYDIHFPATVPYLQNQQTVTKIGQNWNMLPIHLKTIDCSKSSFSYKIRNHYLKNYNPNCEIPSCFICARQK